MITIPNLVLAMVAMQTLACGEAEPNPSSESPAEEIDMLFDDAVIHRL